MTQRDNHNIGTWTERILRGDVQAISQAITAVENRAPESRELLKRLFPHTGHAVLIGVTGPSGAGKSTLVAALTALLRQQGKTVGILAVDPTSPFSGGAILGDRIRMQAHINDPGAYIRSMATRGAMGGLARATLDAALVLDASGKDYILIETVGVGQDEVEIAGLADVTLVVLVPGLGDDIQAFKAGLMEIADVFVINKADLAGAERVEMEVEGALSLAASEARQWQPPIVKTIAARGEGIGELIQTISSFRAFSEQSGTWTERRQNHWQKRLLELLRDHLMDAATKHLACNGAWSRHAAAVAVRTEDPYTVVEEMIASSASGSKPETTHAPDAAVLDHLGVAVNSLTEAVPFYEQMLGLKITGMETIPQEKTTVAMLQVGEPRIELLEPAEADSPVGRFLAKRGEGLHHICLRVPDLTATVERLRQSGIRLVNPEPQIGAGGHRYVFVHPSSAGGVLLELVEAGPFRDDKTQNG